MSNQQQQQVDKCINGLVEMLVDNKIEIPTAIVNPDKLSDNEILDKLIELVQDYNLEYKISVAH